MIFLALNGRQISTLLYVENMAFTISCFKASWLGDQSCGLTNYYDWLQNCHPIEFGCTYLFAAVTTSH